MAKIPGSVQVTGFFAPTDSEDTFGVSDPRWGVGGFSTWESWAAIKAIPAGRRRLGMIVFNQNTADTLSGYFKLTTNRAGDTTIDTDWTPFAGGDGNGDKYYEYDNYISTESSLWIIDNHGLDKKPSVTIVGSDNIEIEAEITYVSNTEIHIKFNIPFKGRAFLN
ncbi:MAG: hypothetical protein KAH32_04740 [Chlamydiia bacterium]|nr:hypothetical protein [Chlamydiia bacterium]